MQYKANRGKKIGKKMMNSLYIHKSALNTLSKDEMSLVSEKMKYIGDFNFDIIKITLKQGEVSFTRSPDWDTISEPSVGESIRVLKDNTIKQTKATNLIYHHKWMFVTDDYTGFDVQESKNWSEFWMNHPKILAMKENKDEKFNSKIGRREYWENVSKLK